MSSNIYAKVAPLLKERKSNIDMDDLLNFMERYKKNNFIYPGVMHRELKIDIKDVYEILEMGVTEGILEQYLEIYCPRCCRFTGQIFQRLTDIPEDVYCITCDEEISNPLKHAIVIYRVI